jgi:predicted AAA+ superfamily ATPase
MERKITESLLRWKTNPKRKPLVLNGARQTGKTWIVTDFGKKQYRDFAYFNLEKSANAAALFEGDIDPKRLVSLLSSLHGRQIEPEHTLIFLDEAQAAGRALTSLKYFMEDAPEYHVIAAGSLLGVAASRKGISYPVGKVEHLSLYPLDFEEFLWALGQKLLSSAICEQYQSMCSFPLHDSALSWYRQYLVTGGMPEVVSRFAETQDFNGLREMQALILDSYVADITKYAQATESVRIYEAYNSLPKQLLKENHKFKYSHIKSGARASQFLYPLAWLEAARLTLSCKEVTEGLAPLAVHENPDAFKLYLSDVGLLCARYEVNPFDIVEDTFVSTLFKGSLAENYVMQQLVSLGFTPRYWGRPRYAEVDFVITDSCGSAVPVEVKSGTNVRSKSLTIFREKYGSPYAVRISAKNFGSANDIRGVPLYATFCLI